jgi:glycosyltransferase involved in cell wall biosynthesis
MRIAQIAPFYGDEIAGAENSVSLLLDYLLKRDGINITIFTTRRITHHRNAHSIPILGRIPQKIIIVGNPILDLLTAKLLLNKIKVQGNFDLIHVQDVVCLPAGVSVAEKLDIPLVVTVRDSLPRSIDDDNYSWVIAYMGSLLLKYQDTNRFNALQKCGKVIAISDFIKNSLVNQGVMPEFVETIYNPIGKMFTDQDTWRPNEPSKLWGSDKSSVRIFAAGRLCKEKGFHVLLEALPRVIEEKSDISLIIAGSGPYTKHLKAICHRLDLNQHVRFVGRIPFIEMNEFYADADLVIVPSVFTEPLGRSVLEAMASGKAIIASAVGAIPELLDDRESGWLIPPENSEALSLAILTLIKDNYLRNSMGRKAREKAIKEFNDFQSVNRVIEVYNSVI